MCSVGSAPLAPYVVERLQEKMPDALVSNNYGMTEAGSAYCIMPKGEAVKRPGSVGQIAPPAVVRIVDEHHQPLPPDVVGEVRLQMPGRQREYFEDPAATAEMWRDGWLVTGDLGKLDADGYLYIVGRSKDVIIRGGNNVHATDVEHALVQHEGMKEVAVVGAPHPVLGEDVVAFVVLHPGVRADTEELRAFGLEHLADYKVPRQFVFVDELPAQPDRQGRQARAAGTVTATGLIQLGPRTVDHAAARTTDWSAAICSQKCESEWWSNRTLKPVAPTAMYEPGTRSSVRVVACDAPMNSARSFTASFRGPRSTSRILNR